MFVKRDNNIRGGRGVRRGRSGFYRVKTSVGSEQSSDIIRRREYRRQKLSKIKRAELAASIRSKVKWLIVLVIAFILFNSLQFKSLKIVGPADLTDADKEKITDVTNRYFESNSKNKLFFDTDDYTTHILESISFVSWVKPHVGLLSTSLEIELKTKLAFMRYRSQTIDVEQNYWVANDGTLVEETTNDENSRDESLELFNGSGAEYSSGDAILSPEQVKYIQLISDKFKKSGVILSSVALSQNVREFRLSVVGEDYQILVATDRSISSTVADYLQLADSLGAKLNPSEYIDLRIIDKAFIR